MLRFLFSKLDEFFYYRYVDKVSKQVMREYMENPVVFVDEKGNEYWVGYQRLK